MIHTYNMIVQCASGTYSGSNASSCTACPAGKYSTNASGSTEAASCTAVSICTLVCVLECAYVHDCMPL